LPGTRQNTTQKGKDHLPISWIFRGKLAVSFRVIRVSARGNKRQLGHLLISRLDASFRRQKKSSSAVESLFFFWHQQFKHPVTVGGCLNCMGIAYYILYCFGIIQFCPLFFFQNTNEG